MALVRWTWHRPRVIAHKRRLPGDIFRVPDGQVDSLLSTFAPFLVSAEGDRLLVEGDESVTAALEVDEPEQEEEAGEAESEIVEAEQDAGKAEQDAGKAEQDAGKAEQDAGKAEQEVVEITAETGYSQPEPEASQAAARLAEEHGIDLYRVQGTGIGGKIIQPDVQRVIEERG